MDDDDYRRLTDCIFYEIFEDSTIDAFMFYRHRWDDSVHRYSGLIPEYLYGGKRVLDELFRHEESRSDTIRKEVTEEIIEHYLPGSVHFPFGGLTEPFQPGRYWMYMDERDVTNPVFPMNDRLGVLDWTVHDKSRGAEERFSGDLCQAVRRLKDSELIEATLTIDRIMSGEDEISGDPDRLRRCYLTSDRFANVVFTLDGPRLLAHRRGEQLFDIPIEKIDHFVQGNSNRP